MPKRAYQRCRCVKKRRGGLGKVGCKAGYVTRLIALDKSFIDFECDTFRFEDREIVDESVSRFFGTDRLSVHVLLYFAEEKGADKLHSWARRDFVKQRAVWGQLPVGSTSEIQDTNVHDSPPSVLFRV